MFDLDTQAALEAPLDPKVVKKRGKGDGMSYVEGWYVIDRANEVFGFEGWQRETVTLSKVQEAAIDGKWSVAYLARCKISVNVGDGWITREGIGFGNAINFGDLGLAHESAAKEAETDAMKRALVTFGYGFGLALYDKQKEHVGNGKTELDMSEQIEELVPWLKEGAEQGTEELKKRWNNISVREAKVALQARLERYWKPTAVKVDLDKQAALRAAHVKPERVNAATGGFSKPWDDVPEAFDDQIPF
jgi:DNA repair and recombination protein RAD52